MSGKWSTQLQKCHINFLEVMAIYLSLRKVNPHKGAHVRIVSDSAVAVACVNRGGSRSPQINSAMRSLISLAVKKKWDLSAQHLKGSLNVIADLLSRDSVAPTEWTLDEVSKKKILSLTPPPQVDLFATRLNCLLSTYVSPMTDSSAAARDAFLVDWNNWSVIYLFPPIPLISKALLKLKEFRGTAYVVAPHWPNSHWFLTLQSMTIRKLPLLGATLSQVVGGVLHTASSFLSRDLHVWIFSGISMPRDMELM